ncbi:MAG: hypothetical protein IJZ74_10985 [Clostridia bacterium]|nr:hypothetical protein [Clostridia bacterium]
MYPRTSVSFRTGDTALQRLFDTAVRKCLNNLNMFGEDQVLVEGGGYEKIWLETQPMGGEMYAGHNMTAAMNNQLLFMRHQRADGRLAGSIQGFPDGTVEAQFNKFQGFCFPWPALNMYYWIEEDRMYLDRLADCLERFDAYLWRVRDSDGDGVLESWCVYDTGEDNAVRYGDAPNYATEDVPPQGSSVVPMASMDVTSFSYACRDTLAEISRIRQDGREAEWRRAADAVAAVIRDKLWDERRGACFDKDRHGCVIDVLCHNTLRCMYWGSISQEMADRFVSEHLLAPEEFWTPLPLPSVSVSDPAFRNAVENNWSGQCEGLTYQRAILALERYGYHKLVTVLGKKLMQAVIDGGYVFTQQFDPFTGAPSCVSQLTKEPLPPDSDEPFQDAYGPTLLSVLEYIAHIWGVTMVRGQMWFSLGSGSAYAYEQVWGDHVYRIESDGKEARVLIDGAEKHRSPCGIRLITDRAGHLLGRCDIE